MKGIHYRAGGSRCRPVEHTEMQQVDSGQPGLSDQEGCFAGTRRAFRTPYDGILSIHPYADAVGVCREAASTKTPTFKRQEGWFAHNHIMALTGGQPSRRPPPVPLSLPGAPPGNLRIPTLFNGGQDGY